MTIIYKQDAYQIVVEPRPNAEAIQLLLDTRWGTKGPIFQHLDTAERAACLEAALTFTLYKNEKVMGTCTVLDREIIQFGRKYRTWYGRYFAIDKAYQGSVYGNLLLKQMKSYLQQFDGLPTIFYAYVEPANPRSAKLLKHTGFNVIRNFETTVFSRFYPKKDKRVNRMQDKEGGTLLSLLDKHYEDNIFVNFDNLFFQNNYFVLKIDNEIIAGLQASVVKWKVDQLPGISGKIIVSILPYLPFISRLFNPKDFRFAAFEGIYCKQGYEKEVFKLMESACAELGLCLGMLWMDSECKTWKRIKNEGKWGIMNKIRRELPASVVAGFRDVPKEEQKYFHENPAYISAFDLT